MLFNTLQTIRSSGLHGKANVLSLIPRVLFIFALLASWGCSGDERAVEQVAVEPEAGPAETGVIGISQNQQVQNRGEGKDQWWDELPRESWSAFEKVEVSQTWFDVYKVGPGVFAIYEPGQFEEVISYLMLGDERALLFDTGLGIGDMHQLVRELTDLDVVVINSHSHYDHIGGNHAFEKVLSPDTEYTRKRSKGLAHEQVAEFVGPGWIWKEAPAGFSPESYETKGFEIHRFLEDREVIDLGGRRLEVLLTPGHAPDALCLFDRENGLLLTGDTFYLAPLYTHLEGSSFDQYLETTRLLADLAPAVRRILPAHNETGVPGSYLIQLRDAFEQVAAGMDPTVITDGNREYAFDGFSIMTREDGPADSRP